MHGGDIYRNKVKIDFSVNVNPFGMPKGVVTALHEAVEDGINYPDTRNDRLKKSISKMLGVKKENIMCGNGSSELFPAVVRAVEHYRGSKNSNNDNNNSIKNNNKPLKIMIPVPSFSGYERAAKSCSADIVFYEMGKENDFCLTDDFTDCLESGIDMVFLANPNNPTGRVIENNLLERILKICDEKNIITVLDECFIEFVKGYEKISFINRLNEFHNLIIVRSFTKIFAMPGVRLGYLVCDNQELMENIKLQLPEWNISVFAQKAGTAAAAEDEFIKNIVNAIEKEKKYLAESLIRMGITVYPGCANFLLLYTCFPLAEHLLEKGILIRDCSDFRGLIQGYYRICIRNREDNEKLLSAVRENVDNI